MTKMKVIQALAEPFRYIDDSYYIVMLEKYYQMYDIELFQRTTVGEILFEGFKDPIHDMLDDFNDNGIGFPNKYDKFGWFYPRNLSTDYDGQITMAIDEARFGQALLWNGEDHVSPDIYNGACGQVKGSAGEYFMIGQEPTFLDYFSPDLCR